jgi:hypothetical protein
MDGSTTADLESRVQLLEEQIDLLADFIGRLVGVLDETTGGLAGREIESGMSMGWEARYDHEGRRVWGWHLGWPPRTEPRQETEEAARR